jgi:hypothetical protein
MTAGSRAPVRNLSLHRNLGVSLFHQPTHLTNQAGDGPDLWWRWSRGYGFNRCRRRRLFWNPGMGRGWTRRRDCGWQNLGGWVCLCDQLRGRVEETRPGRRCRGPAAHTSPAQASECRGWFGVGHLLSLRGPSPGGYAAPSRACVARRRSSGRHGLLRSRSGRCMRRDCAMTFASLLA